jgi:4-amino-4-deoxy-L-arabinose transferase-like glycosyltransferase
MLFREHPPNLIPRFYHLPGFYVADGDAGTIIPQFYPLHPVWLAVAHGVGGVTAGLYLTPLWGLLGVLAVYFAAREAFGDMRLAAVTAGLLAITSTQVWFARYPTAEALTQFLLFAGLYAFARYARRGEGWSAAVAGAALGQVMLVRLDAYFLLGVPLAYAVYLRLRRRLDRRFWLFAAPMLLMSLHSIIHAAWQGWPYFYNSFLGGGSAVLPLPSGVLVGGAAVAAALFVVIDRKVAAQPDWAARLRPTWRVALNVAAIGLILIAVYGYFVRPALADPLSASPYWYSSSTIPDVEPFNLVRLGWYLSPLGIALGALGAAWLLRDGLTERTWPMIGVGIFFSLLYVYRTYNNPHHIYVMRRYVPVVFPFASLCVAYVLVRLSDWQGWGRALAIGLALAQVGLLVYTGRVAIRQVDYAGGVEQFRAFAALIPPDAIVLFNDDEPVGTAGIFGTPLAYLDGRTVIDLQEDRLDLDRLDALTGGWLAAGRPVIVVEGPSRVSGLCDRWACRPFGVGRFDMPALEASYEHFPTEIVRWQYALDVYGVDAVP